MAGRFSKSVLGEGRSKISVEWDCGGDEEDLSEVEMLKMRLGELGSRVLSVEFEDEDEEEEGAVQEEEGVVQEEKEKQENDSVQGQAARNPTDGYF